MLMFLRDLVVGDVQQNHITLCVDLSLINGVYRNIFQETCRDICHT